MAQHLGWARPSDPVSPQEGKVRPILNAITQAGSHTDEYGCEVPSAHGPAAIQWDEVGQRKERRSF